MRINIIIYAFQKCKRIFFINKKNCLEDGNIIRSFSNQRIYIYIYIYVYMYIHINDSKKNHSNI